MADLHVYEIGPDKVVAASVDDARAVWCEFTGNKPEDCDEPEQLAEETVLRIFVNAKGEIDDSGETLALTAAEWAKREGRGFLCSSEY